MNLLSYEQFFRVNLDKSTLENEINKYQLTQIENYDVDKLYNELHRNLD